MSLNNSKIKNAKPNKKQYKIFDSGGLFLIVPPNGEKWWRLKYRQNIPDPENPLKYKRVEKSLSLGTYPKVTLAQAREQRHETKKQIAEGLNPSKVRKIQKTAEMGTFEQVDRE